MRCGQKKKQKKENQGEASWDVLETLSYLLSGLGSMLLPGSPLGQTAFLSWSCNSHALSLMEAHWLRKNGILGTAAFPIVTFTL